jgi:hypothetical protein
MKADSNNNNNKFCESHINCTPCNIVCGVKSGVTFITSAEWVGK